MLKKKERLDTKGFNRSFSSKSRKNNQYFGVIYDKTATFHGAVVVGKKIFKSAVKRNKLRRQVYDCLYRLASQNGLNGTYIVLVKPPAKDLKFATLKEELSNLVLAFEKKASKG